MKQILIILSTMLFTSCVNTEQPCKEITDKIIVTSEHGLIDTFLVKRCAKEEVYLHEGDLRYCRHNNPKQYHCSYITIASGVYKFRIIK
jgi:hypothetical protein